MRQKTEVPPKWTRLVCNSAVIALTALCSVANTGRVWATPAAGFTATTIMSGRFDEIDVRNKPLISDSIEVDRRAKAWLATFRRKSRFWGTVEDSGEGPALLEG
jgi:hypothetical protein